MSGKKKSGAPSSANMQRRYFHGTKGEINELREQLAKKSVDDKKLAVKRIIALMTLGKDMSIVFMDVLNNINTHDPELKKLIYLYITNYATTRPELVILSIAAFTEDANNTKPLLRALALRTMSCLNVSDVAEYLVPVLRKCVSDSDPYVRKTVAIAIAKLHAVDPEIVEDSGFVDDLQDMLSDSNAMVIANAVAALSEMSKRRREVDFSITSQMLNTLLTALNECTEWGQVYILDALVNYTPEDDYAASTVCERVSARLQHANSAVVLSAVKVIMKNLESITDEETVRSYCKKMSGPLITLLNAPAEIQYVALRVIQLLIQRRPEILAHETRVFYCVFTDPIFVKIEKIDILVRLATERNIDQLLLEFKDYAQQVDLDYVRKAVRAIGRCAIKLERTADRCVDTLVDLIKTGIDYVVQECIVVLRDIFRRYPQRYESVIEILCAELETLDEPEAKAAMVWILGEYSDQIDGADTMLDGFLESFEEEPPQVQLAFLTASLKMFLKEPTPEGQDFVKEVMRLCTDETDNPDLRDRGYMYWRLLKADPEAAAEVILGETPLINPQFQDLDQGLVNDLLEDIPSLASVYHQPPELISATLRLLAEEDEGESEDEADDYVVDDEAQNQGQVNYGDEDTEDADGDNGEDLISIGDNTTASPSSSSSSSSGLAMFEAQESASSGSDAQPKYTHLIPHVTVLPLDKGNGMQVAVSFWRAGGDLVMSYRIGNGSQSPLNDFAVQFNVNQYGLQPTEALRIGDQNTVLNGASGQGTIRLNTNGKRGGENPALQVAIKNNVKVYYFQTMVPFYLFLTQAGPLGRKEFVSSWKSIDDATERGSDLSSIHTTDVDTLEAFLEENNVFSVVKKPAPDGTTTLYMSAESSFDTVHLVELCVAPSGGLHRLATRSADADYADRFHQGMLWLLGGKVAK